MDHHFFLGALVQWRKALRRHVQNDTLVPATLHSKKTTIKGAECKMRVDSLGNKLKTAMDAGAKKVMIPTENKRDFADLPADIIDKLQIVFYSDPTNAGFRAMGLE